MIITYASSRNTVFWRCSGKDRSVDTLPPRVKVPLPTKAKNVGDDEASIADTLASRLRLQRTSNTTETSTSSTAPPPAAPAMIGTVPLDDADEDWVLVNEYDPCECRIENECEIRKGGFQPSRLAVFGR